MGQLHKSPTQATAIPLTVKCVAAQLSTLPPCDVASPKRMTLRMLPPELLSRRAFQDGFHRWRRVVGRVDGRRDTAAEDIAAGILLLAFRIRWRCDEDNAGLIAVA